MGKISELSYTLFGKLEENSSCIFIFQRLFLLSREKGPTLYVEGGAGHHLSKFRYRATCVLSYILRSYFNDEEDRFTVLIEDLIVRRRMHLHAIDEPGDQRGRVGVQLTLQSGKSNNTKSSNY